MSVNAGLTASLIAEHLSDSVLIAFDPEFPGVTQVIQEDAAVMIMDRGDIFQHTSDEAGLIHFVARVRREHSGCPSACSHVADDVRRRAGTESERLPLSQHYSGFKHLKSEVEALTKLRETLRTLSEPDKTLFAGFPAQSLGAVHLANPGPLHAAELVRGI